MIYFLILNFLVLFSVPISAYTGIFPIYYIYSVLILIHYIVTYKYKKVSFGNEVIGLIIYIFVFIFLFILEAAFNFLPDILTSAKSVLSLTWIPLFLILFFSRINNFDLKKFIHFHIYLGLVISALGIVQYLFSRDLWGLIPRIRLDAFYEDKEFSYRASSILYSEQVFGLYCLLNAILVLEYKKIFKKNLFIFFFFIFIISGLLSGNKSVTALLALYLIFKISFFNYKNRLLVLSQGIVFIVIAFVFFSLIEDNTIIRSFTWLFDNKSVSSTESNSGRLSVYNNILENTNVILGNGVGSTMPSNNENYINTESYYLQLYSEGGLVLLLAFLNFGIRSLIRTYRNRDNRTFFLLIIILSSMGFVHAFGSPVFIGFWVIVIAPLFYSHKLKNS